VAVGFFMDIYIAGPKYDKASGERTPSSSAEKPPPPVPTNVRVPSVRMRKLLRIIPEPNDYYMDMADHPAYSQQHQHHSQFQRHSPNLFANHHHERNFHPPLPQPDSQLYGSNHRRLTLSPTFGTLEESHVGSIGPLPSTERIRLSSTADRHVRFVAHLTSQLAENAIFAYLGLFLFSQNYDWDPTLVTISIIACVLSRTLMVVIVSISILQIYKCRGYGLKGDACNTAACDDIDIDMNNKGSPDETKLQSSRTATAIQDPRTQAVLILAGLRGAVSLALVENVPIYNNVSGEGCEFKPLMKGMTSASILFTTFVFGGGAYYILPLLGINPDDADKGNPMSPRIQNLELQHTYHPDNDTANGVVTQDNMEFYIETTMHHANPTRCASPLNDDSTEHHDADIIRMCHSMPIEETPRVI
jgi:hypothetical protein